MLMGKTLLLSPLLIVTSFPKMGKLKLHKELWDSQKLSKKTLNSKHLAGNIFVTNTNSNLDRLF